MDKFPRRIRPFYTHPDPSNPDLSNSYDFFMRGQEIMSGAQRIHDYETLCKNMRESDPPLDPKSEGFRHYTEAFKWGCSPHGMYFPSQFPIRLIRLAVMPGEGAMRRTGAASSE